MQVLRLAAHNPRRSLRMTLHSFHERATRGLEWAARPARENKADSSSAPKPVRVLGITISWFWVTRSSRFPTLRAAG